MGIRNTISEINFDKQRAAQYKLSILVGMDSFFYAVSSGSNEILVIKDIELETPLQNGGLTTTFNKLRDKEELLQLPYRQVKVGISSPASTLIPQRLFSISKLHQYLSPIVEITEQQAIYRDELPTLDLTHVYAIDAAWKTLLEQGYSYHKTYHLNTVLLRSYQRLQRGQSGHALYANVSTQNVQLFLYNDSNLLFTNTFHYQSAKDFVYYVLLAYDQFNLSPSEIPLQLSGQILKDSELYKLLYRYIKTLKFISITDLAKPGERFQATTPLHQYFDLISLMVY